MATSSIQRTAASGSTAVFSVPFPYLDKSHVQVRVAGVLKTFGVDYTWPTSSTIQLTAGNPTAGTIVERRRVTPVDPLTVFQPGNLDSGDLNVAELQPLYVAQEATDDEQDRNAAQWATPSTTPGLPGTGGTIEHGVSGNFLAYDAEGNIIDSGRSPEDLEASESNAAASAIAAAGSANNASISAAAASSSASSAGGSATLAQKWASNPEDNPVTTGPNLYSALHWAAKAAASAASIVPSLFMQKAQNLADVTDKVAAQGNLNYQRIPGNATFAITSSPTKMSQRADLRDWSGLDLTGTNDMASLLQSALNTMASTGEKLSIPAGKIILGSAVAIPGGAIMEGQGNPARQQAPSATGTFFHIGHTGNGFTMSGSPDLGRVLRGFGTYRDQPAFGAGWAPNNLGSDILVKGCNDVRMEHLFLANPTKGIEITGDTVALASNQRIYMRDIAGQPFKNGIIATHCVDVIYLDEIHFWPFNRTTDNNVVTYMRNNAVALTLGRVDNPKIGRFFSWGMGVGVNMYNETTAGLPQGSVSLLKADMLGIDASGNALVVDVGSTATYDIDMLYGGFSSIQNNNYIVEVKGTNSRGVIKNIYGGGTNGGMVWMYTGSGNDLKVGVSRSILCDMDANNSPEFIADVGNTLTLTTKPITSAATKYAFAGTGRVNSPEWINFTPVITSSVGTITTVATPAAGDCKYKLENGTCTFDYTITITTNGTGAGALQATLPLAAKKIGAGCSGAVGGFMVKGLVQSGVARVDIQKYDGTYPGSDGAVIRVSGTFEAG